jgi:para-nitrobenzyl esterase
VPNRIVDTTYGRVSGLEESGLLTFRGIRYASAPIGDLRFRPPAPPAPWDGVFEATEFGPIAPQADPIPGLAIPGDPMAWDEDCLFLNVWTPGADDAARPVMVFIHGGAFVGGGGTSQLYSGAGLTTGHDVVVVTINYRLGVLGFLADEALYDEVSGGFGNWGLLDQIAALEWVRDNIAGFGGDPSNVTIFGESAGAISVCNLLAVPRAAGLFRRAIAESGPAVAAGPDRAAEVAALLARELGLAAPTREALADVPVHDLLAAQARVISGFETAIGLAFEPVVDGGLLTCQPAQALAAGNGRDVDLIIGTNRDEFTLFALGVPGLNSIDEAGMLRRVRKSLRAAGMEGRVDPDDAVAAYRSAREARGTGTEPFELFAAMASDWVFRIPSLRLAEAHARNGGRTWSYLFDWESPFAGGTLGSCHALELPFVFGTLVNPFISAFSGADEQARELSATMQAAWTSFARDGEPTEAATPRGWPRYDAEDRWTMIFGPDTRPVQAPFEEERLFWDRALGSYGEEEIRAAGARARASQPAGT